MFNPFFSTWLDMMNASLQCQTAVASSLLGSTVQISTSLTFGPRRRSTAKLTLVSSNNWVRSHKSKANLRVISN